MEKSRKVQDWCARLVSDTMIIPLVNHDDDGNENVAKQKVLTFLCRQREMTKLQNVDDDG